MSSSAQYLVFQQLSEGMRAAAEAERWDELDRLQSLQVALIATLPPPVSGDRPYIERALAELTTAIAHASTHRDQIAGLLKAFGGRAAP